MLPEDVKAPKDFSLGALLCAICYLLQGVNVFGNALIALLRWFPVKSDWVKHGDIENEYQVWGGNYLDEDGSSVILSQGGPS